MIGRGRAELTEDVQEKIRGLSLFMKNQTGREFNILSLIHILKKNKKSLGYLSPIEYRHRLGLVT